MKRDAFLAVAAATALAAVLLPASAWAQAKGAGTPVTKVRIVGDRFVVVDQHPIVVLKGNTQGRIVWELPPKPSAWRFRDDSIAIDGGQFLGCHVEAQGLRYACTDKAPRTAQVYPYRVTIYDGAGADAKAIHTDSAVQNE